MALLRTLDSTAYSTKYRLLDYEQLHLQHVVERLTWQSYISIITSENPVPMGGFSVGLRPPVVTNLFNSLNILYWDWGGRGGGGEGLLEISKSKYCECNSSN